MNSLDYDAPRRRAGQVGLEDVGSLGLVVGWLHRLRDHGKLIFFDLASQNGTTQVVTDDPQHIRALRQLRGRAALEVCGLVCLRAQHHEARVSGGDAVELRYRSHHAWATLPPIDASSPQDTWPTELVRESRVLSLLRHALTASGMIDLSTAVVTPSLLSELSVLPLVSVLAYGEALAIAGIERWFYVGPAHLTIGSAFGDLQELTGSISALISGVERDQQRSASLAGSLVFQRSGFTFGAEIVTVFCHNKRIGDASIVDSQKLQRLQSDHRSVHSREPELLGLPIATAKLDLREIMNLVLGPCSGGGKQDAPPTLALRTEVESTLLSEGRVNAAIEILAIRDQIEILTRLHDANRLSSELTSLATLRPLLPEFSMDYENACAMLDALPTIKDEVLRRPPEHLFQLIWSLLGNTNCQGLLDSETALDDVRRLAVRGIITEYRQLTYIEPSTVDDINEILNMYEGPHIDDTLRRLLSTYPGSFASLLHSWVLRCQRGEKLPLSALHDAARSGCITPIFFNFFIADNEPADAVAALRTGVSRIAPLLLQNRPIQIDEVLSSFLSCCDVSRSLAPSLAHQLIPELVYHSYRPVNMSLRRLTTLFAAIEDRTSDVILAGLSPCGEGWDRNTWLYRSQSCHLYLSKNRAAFFGKAAAGICTADDVCLYNRSDHFHLNIVDPQSPRVVGNVQMYATRNAKETVLLVRAINPSTSFVTGSNAGAIVYSVLDAICSLARCSGYDTVYLCDSKGIWNVDSARPEVRVLLDHMRQSLRPVDVTPPLHLFSFGSRDITLTRAFVLWSKAGLDYNGGSH